MIVEGYRVTVRRDGTVEVRARARIGGLPDATGWVSAGAFGWTWGVSSPFETALMSGYAGLDTRREAVERLVERVASRAPA